MRTQMQSARNAAGFSLVEVMIAVIVLAVGLLALVGLQTRLVREGAEAKARSRIAALVSSRMDEARAGGYFALASQAALSCANGNDICEAQTDAAVSGLSMGQTVTTTTSVNSSEFKTLTVTANWTDSAGQARSLSMRTLISPLSLDTSSTLLNQQLSGDAAKSPIVRTSDPATAGVVPIALGNGSASAASNPTPELIGRNDNQEVVGTRFNVLTYVPSGGNAVIQKRIETAVVKCTCQYGAGGTNLGEIYRASQWPAIWTGERYELFRPEAVINPPGQGLNAGPAPGIEQSPLCQECCRDHHDGTSSTVAKFDPERTDGLQSKFQLSGNNLTQVSDRASGTYLNACRIIRVDGLWRTASDMYARQLGLLETGSVNNVKAKTGLPTSAATSAYTTFVKSYLRQYTGSTAIAPANAEELFNGTAGLNEPAVVPVAVPSTSDLRYLHARGLYVDYLEKAARQKIADVLADNGPRGRCPTGTAREDCVMPYLPFTSANLTEIAKWIATDDAVLGVNSGNLLATNPSQPSGGRTYGKKGGAADTGVTTRLSNSGIAVNTALATVGGVDPTDHGTELNDAQAFEVGGGGTDVPGTGDEFFVNITGGGANPFVFYVLGDDTGECIKLANGMRPCTTNSTLPMGGSVRIERYWKEDTDRNRTISGTCRVDGGTTLITATDKLDVPQFWNYQITAASVGGVSGTIGSPVHDNTTSEATTVSFASIPKSGTVSVTLALQSNTPTYATIASCDTNSQGNKITNVVWNKAWER